MFFKILIQINRLIYKISGTWGNHEGSMLLWLSILSIYGFFFSFTKNIDKEFKNLHLKFSQVSYFILVYLLFLLLILF